MSCVYYLKDSSGNEHLFRSELALDDFLLTNQRLKNDLGDAVFSMASERQAITVAKIEQIRDAAKDGTKNKERRLFYDGDSKLFLMKAPFIGVNRYINGYKDSLGNSIIPVFIEENYWEGVPQSTGVRVGGRYASWANGEYTEAESIELERLFKESKSNNGWMDIDKDASADNKYKGMKLKDPVDWAVLRAAVEYRWQMQCLIGDAIHSVLEKLLTKDITSGILWRDLVTTPEGANKFYQELSNKKYKKKNGEWIKFDALMPTSLFNAFLKEALKFTDNLKAQFGEEAVYFPECPILGTLGKKDVETGADKLYGIIDLLVVDKDGNVHILDYKTSIKNYGQFYSSKLLTFRYQIAAYLEILKLWGLTFSTDSDKNSLAIVPITIDEFAANHSAQSFKYKGISFENVTKGNTTTNWHLLMLDILATKNDIIHTNLQDIIPVSSRKTVATEKLLSNTADWMNSVFKAYHGYKVFSDDEIRDMIREAGGFEKQTSGEYLGKYVFQPKNSNWTRPIVIDPTTCKDSSPEKVMFFTVRKVMQRAYMQRSADTDILINYFRQGQKDGIEAVDWVEQGHGAERPGSSPEWLKSQLQRYMSISWEVMEGPEWSGLKLLGIIALYNKSTHTYNFIKISSADLYSKFNFNGDNLLSSALGKSDTDYLANSNALMMESVRGNIELMEATAAINQLSSIFGSDAMVGEIVVMNPTLGMALRSPSNKQLIWTFNELSRLANKEGGNHIKSGEIRFATQLNLAELLFQEIMELGTAKTWQGDYLIFNKVQGTKKEQFQTCLDEFSKAVLDNSIPNKVQVLTKLLKMLEKIDRGRNKTWDVLRGTDISTMQDPYIQLYNKVLLALSEVKGSTMVLQVRDHDLWLDEGLKKGLSGTAYDNPGNLKSPLLNKMSNLVLQAQLKIRQELQKPRTDLYKLIKELKEAQGYNKLKEYTYGNETDLYKNMFIIDEQLGIFKFKNPWDPSSGLNAAEKNFLIHVLEVINSRRHADMSKEKIDELRKSGDELYYNVPLMKGDGASQFSRKGFIGLIKDKLSAWSPKEILARFQYESQGYTDSGKRKNLFEITNGFDNSEDPKMRKAMLSKGIGYWETNLETLLLTYDYTYMAKQHIDEVMPLIHACMVSLLAQGFDRNAEYSNDLQWCHDYLVHSIRNESIVPENQKVLQAYILKLLKFSSVMALGLNPVQFTYQTLQGIWNDVGMVFLKPDGSNAFTFENFKKAGKCVYSDLFVESGKPTMTSQLNALYAFNDMDMNSYARNNVQNKHGLFNLTNFFYKFTSRPDYYNRMLLFTAKMINDGCYEAHTLNKDGLLEYDWTKDKRFSAFAADPKGTSTEILNQRAMYIAMVLDFINEGTMVEQNGELVPLELNLEKPMPLPRAYTFKEVESAKALSDKTYGYYTHERRSLFQATLIGSLFFLMKTYWSGKKNQYLAHGGIKSQGQYKLAEELNTKTGKVEKLYYLVADDGTILYDKPLVFESEASVKIAPAVRWEGNWEEGILLTIGSMLRSTVVKHHGNLIEAYREKWYDENPKLRLCYRSNLKKFAYDLIMFAVIGSIASAGLLAWKKDLKKKLDMTDPVHAAVYVGADMAYRTVRSSFLDFNFIDSIGSPTTTWTPFAFEMLTRNLSNVFNAAMGDGDFSESVLKSTAITNELRPFINALTYTPEN